MNSLYKVKMKTFMIVVLLETNYDSSEVKFNVNTSSRLKSVYVRLVPTSDILKRSCLAINLRKFQ